MPRDALLLHHPHTPDSNRFEQEVRGLQIDSHACDYVELARRFPRSMDAVIVKTDHWQTDPGYYDRLESRLDEMNVDLTRFTNHVCFELGGSRMAIINSVEAAVERQRYHITICGLPIDSSETYTVLEFSELKELATEAAWIAPAHIGMPFHRLPGDLVDSICGLADAPTVQVALGYTTGYFRLYNRVARNEVPNRTGVIDYAETYNLPLLPELDLHTAVPEGLSGCGVVSSTVMDDLREGIVPVREIMQSDLLRPDGCRRGITVRQFLYDYSAFTPFLEGRIDRNRHFRELLPETEWLSDLDVRSSTEPLL